LQTHESAHSRRRIKIPAIIAGCSPRFRINSLIVFAGSSAHHPAAEIKVRTQEQQPRPTLRAQLEHLHATLLFMFRRVLVKRFSSHFPSTAPALGKYRRPIPAASNGIFRPNTFHPRQPRKLRRLIHAARPLGSLIHFLKRHISGSPPSTPGNPFQSKLLSILRHDGCVRNDPISRGNSASARQTTIATLRHPPRRAKSPATISPSVRRALVVHFAFALIDHFFGFASFLPLTAIRP